MKQTISDVAKLSGVSTGTVSRVLNDRPGVKKSTRDKVLKVVEELGYVPESAARDLSNGKSLTIGIHMNDGGISLSPFNILFIRYVSRKILGLGGRIVELNSQGNGLPIVNADGVILLGANKGDPRINYLEEINVPHVLIGHDLGKSSICPDDINGGNQVAKYLVDCGHKNMLHITGKLSYQSNADRLKGFVEVLNEQNITLGNDRVIQNIETRLDSYRALMRFNKHSSTILKDITAIFCGSDEIAVGVITALGDLGIDVPGDMSVVGFDDMPEVGDGITTVHQNIQGIAESSCELLIDQINGAPAVHKILPVQLIIRKTTGINIADLKY